MTACWLSDSRTPWKLDGCPMTYDTISGGRGGFVAAWPTREANLPHCYIAIEGAAVAGPSRLGGCRKG